MKWLRGFGGSPAEERRDRSVPANGESEAVAHKGLLWLQRHDDFFRRQGWSEPDRWKRITENFQQIFPWRPIQDNVQGLGNLSQFFLFFITRMLDPLLVVESGVWRGQTSWLLRQACPQAEMHSFDISFKKLLFKDRSIRYHRHDWVRKELQNHFSDRAMIFFDDHVDQALRIEQAQARGFRWLVFDDNVLPERFADVGVPPLPTVRMILDANWRDGEVITWEFQGKVHRYILSRQHMDRAAQCVSDYLEFPTGTGLTVVKLNNQRKAL